MCDYSLGGRPNRLATEGDELVVHRFPTYSMGLASAAELQTRSTSLLQQTTWERIKAFFAVPAICSNAQAVCVPPGASLILENIPVDLQRKWGVADEESVFFTQTGADANTYRDAICFASGRQVLLQHLSEGIHVKVVSLGSDPLVTEAQGLEELTLGARL